LAELRQLDNAFWFIPGADVTPGRPAGDYPYRGRAPHEREFGIATVREILERYPGVFLNFDIKQTAPVVEPYEAALASLLAEFGRVDGVIVASFLDPAPRRSPRSHPMSPPRRDPRHRRILAGRQRGRAVAAAPGERPAGARALR